MNYASGDLRMIINELGISVLAAAVFGAVPQARRMTLSPPTSSSPAGLQLDTFHLSVLAELVWKRRARPCV